MFTGIITDVGSVRRVDRSGGDARFEFDTKYDMSSVDIGASIACSGCCLTVIEKGPGWFAVQVSAETLARTTLGDWRDDSRVNLERALKVGDELGGHIVSGHVDGVASLVERRSEGDSVRFVFEAPEDIAKFVAPKGSVAIEGVSLTVNEVSGRRFGINVIPHTQDSTTLGALVAGGRVNMEIDMLARYVARLMEKDGS
jgi:riboflavin synthase